MHIFFDIETAPDKKYEELSPWMKSLWKDRYCKKMKEWTTPEEHYYNTAWLYAEYSKILCISAWYFKDDWTKDINTFHKKEETENIRDFFNKTHKHKLAWFNIKWFDMAFMCKRAAMSWLKIPFNINHIGKKPRDSDVLDLMETWKFWWWMGASLGLACEAMWIESPKWEIQWNMMWVYYHSDEFNIEKVVAYCENDVRATMELYEKTKKYFTS